MMDEPGHPVSQTTKISVAICTWNRSKLLAMALEHLAKVTRPGRMPWEVLVVNNGCFDDTSAVVSSFAERLPVREVAEPRLGLSAARNRAVDESTGSHVAFIDDDVLVEEEWLAVFADLVERYPRAAAFGGPVRAYFPVSSDPDVVAAFPYLRKGFCEIDRSLPEGPLQRRVPRPTRARTSADTHSGIAGPSGEETLRRATVHPARVRRIARHLRLLSTHPVPTAEAGMDGPRLSLQRGKVLEGGQPTVNIDYHEPE